MEDTRSSLDATPSLEALLPLVLGELRVLAHRQLSAEREQVTLQTTELVHEAYLRLAGNDEVAKRGRSYFFASAAQAMRRVLVDAARRRTAAKRGSGAPLISLGAADQQVSVMAEDLLVLNDVLEVLERRNPRQAQVVQYRYFAGLSVDETAEILGVSPRTVKADWALSRAWLAEQFTTRHARLLPGNEAP